MRWRRGSSLQADLKAASTIPETFERQREMRAAAAADHRVNFVDDHRADRAQHLAASRGCQQQVATTRASSPGCAVVCAAWRRARTRSYRLF